MALAATRCLDSLTSCSSVRLSSCGMADRAPTCICILICFGLATIGMSVADRAGYTRRHDHRGNRRDLHRAAGAGLPGAEAVDLAPEGRRSHAERRTAGRGEGARVPRATVLEGVRDVQAGGRRERFRRPPRPRQAAALDL